MDIKDIYKSIRPLKNKMHLNNAILCITTAFLAAGCICAVLAYTALLFPVTYLWQTIIKVYAASIALSLVTALFLRPGNIKAMKKADSLGLKERLITAYELRDDSNPLSILQRKDALKEASEMNYRKLYSLKLPKKYVMAALALVFLIGASFLIPSPAKDKAYSAELLKKEITKQAEKLDSERKALNKSSSLSDKVLSQLNKKIDQMLGDLKKSKNEADALKTLSKAKHDLEALKQQDSDLKKLADALSNNQLTKELSQALKNNNATDIKQEMEQLSRNLQKMSDADKKALSDSLKQASQALSPSNELSQSLAAASQAVSSGNSGSASDKLASLSDSLAQAAQSNSEDVSGQLADAALNQLSSMLDDARTQISDSGSNLPGTSVALSGLDGQNGQGENGGQGQGSGSGDQGQNGSGSGDGKSNKGGGGAGNTSSNGDLGYSGDESGSGSRQPGEKQAKDYENIYTSKRLGG
ncbi:MAG: hypothetical protein Q8920_03075, partial [Bacillota bacterium]|nr:hypothetical protein [Bacillota bacterium]